MTNFKKIVVPPEGKKISIINGRIVVPDNPIIPFIEGDGTGHDIWFASQMVFDSAIKKVYKGRKKIVWVEVYAGEKAVEKYGKNQWLPQETLDAIKEYVVAIKGPLTTPIGGGRKSLNVTLRQELDLFACVRPVKYYSGTPSAVKHPKDLDIVIFRENTEDVYEGIEFKAKSKDAVDLINYINKKYKKNIRIESGIGIKSISKFNSERLVKKAIEYAIADKRKSVTLIHKGNIMKYTEGAFKTWGYETAKKYFGDVTITEEELWEKYKGSAPKGKIIIKDRIADTMFQQALLRPTEYDILATPNLNGDYLSDACAAQIGGVGIAPGANMSDYYAVFEAAHGTAPKYTGLDKVNPSSVILSGVMMFKYLGWNKAAHLIEVAMSKTIKKKTVTYDFARFMQGATELSCSDFGRAIVNNM